MAVSAKVSVDDWFDNLGYLTEALQGMNIKKQEILSDARKFSVGRFKRPPNMWNISDENILSLEWSIGKKSILAVFSGGDECSVSLKENAKFYTLIYDFRISENPGPIAVIDHVVRYINSDCEEIINTLANMQRLRDKEKNFEIRQIYNEVCERLDALHSEIEKSLRRG